MEEKFLPTLMAVELLLIEMNITKIQINEL